MCAASSTDITDIKVVLIPNQMVPTGNYSPRVTFWSLPRFDVTGDHWWLRSFGLAAKATRGFQRNVGLSRAATDQETPTMFLGPCSGWFVDNLTAKLAPLKISWYTLPDIFQWTSPPVCSLD